VWKKVLGLIRPLNASTEALLRASKPLFINGNVLTLGVFYKFHKEHLESNAHRQILEETLSNILGLKIKVVCTLTEPVLTNMTTEAVNEATVLTEGVDNDIVGIAEKIFGG